MSDLIQEGLVKSDLPLPEGITLNRDLLFNHLSAFEGYLTGAVDVLMGILELNIQHDAVVGVSLDTLTEMFINYKAKTTLTDWLVKSICLHGVVERRRRANYTRFAMHKRANHTRVKILTKDDIFGILLFLERYRFVQEIVVYDEDRRESESYYRPSELAFRLLQE